MMLGRMLSGRQGQGASSSAAAEGRGVVPLAAEARHVAEQLSSGVANTLDRTDAPFALDCRQPRGDAAHGAFSSPSAVSSSASSSSTSSSSSASSLSLSSNPLPAVELTMAGDSTFEAALRRSMCGGGASAPPFVTEDPALTPLRPPAIAMRWPVVPQQSMSALTAASQLQHQHQRRQGQQRSFASMVRPPLRAPASACALAANGSDAVLDPRRQAAWLEQQVAAAVRAQSELIYADESDGDGFGAGEEKKAGSGGSDNEQGRCATRVTRAMRRGGGLVGGGDRATEEGGEETACHEVDQPAGEGTKAAAMHAALAQYLFPGRGRHKKQFREERRARAASSSSSSSSSSSCKVLISGLSWDMDVAAVRSECERILQQEQGNGRAKEEAAAGGASEGLQVAHVEMLRRVRRRDRSGDGPGTEQLARPFDRHLGSAVVEFATPAAAAWFEEQCCLAFDAKAHGHAAGHAAADRPFEGCRHIAVRREGIFVNFPSLEMPDGTRNGGSSPPSPSSSSPLPSSQPPQPHLAPSQRAFFSSISSPPPPTSMPQTPHTLSSDTAVVRESYSMDAYLDALNRCWEDGAAMEAIEMLTELRASVAPMAPPVIFYHQAIGACARAGYGSGAAQVLAAMRSDGVPVQGKQCTLLFTAFRGSAAAADTAASQKLNSSSSNSAGGGASGQKSKKSRKKRKGGKRKASLSSGVPPKGRQVYAAIPPSLPDAEAALQLLAALEEDLDRFGAEDEEPAEQAEQARPILNTFVYTAALSAVGKSGDWRSATDIVRRMQRRGHRCRPNAHTYASAIQACGEKLVPPEERREAAAAALSLLRELTDGGAGGEGDERAVRADAWVYTNAIQVLGRAGMVDEAVPLLDEMRRARNDSKSPWSGNKVAPQTYTALLSGCAVASPCRWELALSLLRGMEAKDGVRPNAVHYNACLAALAHATASADNEEEKAGWSRRPGDSGDSGDRFADATAVLSDMREAAVAPDTYTFRALLTAQGHSGRRRVRHCFQGANETSAGAAEAVASAEAALELVDAMPAVGVAPNEFVYEAALAACCHVFDELVACQEDTGALPLSSHAISRVSARVLALSEAMRSEGFAPSDDTAQAVRRHFLSLAVAAEGVGE